METKDVSVKNIFLKKIGVKIRKQELLKKFAKSKDYTKWIKPFTILDLIDRISKIYKPTKEEG